MKARWIWENNDNSNSLENSFSITWLQYCSRSIGRRLKSLTGRQVPSHQRHALETPGVTPAGRPGHVSLLRCCSCTGRIYSTSSSRSLPGSWPRTFIFIIGKRARAEEAARKSRSAGLWFVSGGFFFFEEPGKLMVPINGERKVLGLTFILPPPIFILPFLGLCVLDGKSELNSHFLFLFFFLSQCDINEPWSSRKLSTS